MRLGNGIWIGHRKRGGTVAPDGSPSLLTANNVSNTQINFSWTIGSTNQDGHRIYISTDGINYIEKGTVLGVTATYSATGLTAGNLYYFYVVAYKGTQESAATNIYDTRFKITVDTTKAGSANNTFILPTDGASTYDYYVDWGDGGAEDHVQVNTSQTKVYAASSTYQVKIRGTFPRIYFNDAGDKLKLMTIDNWGNIAWLSMGAVFSGCANMETNYTDIPNTSAITVFSDMFTNCTKFNGKVEFNTANATAMNNMFRGCVIFNKSVASFNTSSCTNMATMFMECNAFNQSVAHFDTSNVTDLHYMFGIATGTGVFNGSVLGFNTSVCEIWYNMFCNQPFFNQPVNHFDVSAINHVSGYSDMFAGCTSFNQSLSTWNTANSVSFSKMFLNCISFNQSVSNFDISSATNLTQMFAGCTSFNQSLNSFVPTAATNTSYMFDGCTVFNGLMDNFVTTNVTDMSFMFRNCSAFNRSVSAFSTANVTDMTAMFYSCATFNQSVASFNTANVTSMAQMFLGCTNFDQSVANFNTIKVTTMLQMFLGCSAFNQAVSGFDVTNVTTLAQMFQQCTNFNQDLSGWVITSVTTMDLMFFLANAWSTANYDAALIAWGALVVQNTVPFHAGDAKYTAGGAAETARTHLVLAVGSGGHGWTISDGGSV